MPQLTSTRLTTLVIAILALPACTSARRSAQAPAAQSRIDTSAIRGYTQFLSSDRLAGRATGSQGAEAAAHYIASICTSLGLLPVGGRYLHPIALEEISIDRAATSLRVHGPGGNVHFSTPHEFLLNSGWGPPAGFSGPAVFAETSKDLLSPGAPPVSGAVVVLGMLSAMSHDDSLRARGAVGLVQLSTEDEQYVLYVQSRGDARLRLSDSTIVRSLQGALPSLVASPHLSRRFRNAAGEARVVPLPDTITVSVRLRRQQVESSNVMCLLEGSEAGAKDSAVVYTAHYDHLGIGIPDGRGDSVYNGFSDNAAGVAMLLAIADAMGRRSTEPPAHSILFLFFTGEEQGLLGSDYYVARPQWPTERMLGVINLDAGAPPGRPWSWRIAGGDDNPLGRLARDIAAERGWSATTSPATPNSDYYPFARVGVPAVFIVPGSGPYQGLSVDSSQALRRRWDRYHQPADEWSADFPFAGLGRYAEYAYLLGRALDEGRRARSGSL